MGRLSDHYLSETADLFGDHALARRTDPHTSHRAAHELDARLKGLQLIVCDAFRGKPEGLTNQELCDATGLDWNTCTPRVKPLIDKGYLIDAVNEFGEYITRPSRKSGKQQQVRIAVIK